MIELIEAPDNVVAMTASGTLDAADYDRIIAEVEARLSRHPRIGVVAEMTSFKGLTMEALWKDLKYNAKRIGDWDRFPRCALVTDELWLKSMAAFWDPLIPGVDMKVFKPGETAQAISWAGEV